jgi:hypothetical protein
MLDTCNVTRYTHLRDSKLQAQRTGTLLSAWYQSRNSGSTLVETKAHIVKAARVCLSEGHEPSRSIPASTQRFGPRYLVRARQRKLADHV